MHKMNIEITRNKQKKNIYFQVSLSLNMFYKCLVLRVYNVLMKLLISLFFKILYVYI